MDFSNLKFLRTNGGQILYTWNGLLIKCDRSIGGAYWHMRIECANSGSSNEFNLAYSMGVECTKRAIISALKKMFKNPYKNAKQNLLIGVLNGIYYPEYQAILLLHPIWVY